MNLFLPRPAECEIQLRLSLVSIHRDRDKNGTSGSDMKQISSALDTGAVGFRF